MVFTGYDIVPGNVEGHKKKFNAKSWKFEVKNVTRLCLGTTLQYTPVTFLPLKSSILKLPPKVHDIVADPIAGKYDIILSRHTLQATFIVCWYR